MQMQEEFMTPINPNILSYERGIIASMAKLVKDEQSAKALKVLFNPQGYRKMLCEQLKTN